MKCVYLISATVSILLAVRLAFVFFSQPNADLISWDQAARANEGLFLAKEISNLQIFKFITHVLSLNWWPPLLPILLFPFCLIFGPSLFSAVLPSLLAFPLVVVSLLFLYDNLEKKKVEKKLLGYSLLFTLTVTSPLLVSSASWVMLEIFGVLLTSLIFGFYFRARQSSRLSSYKICAILVFLLWTLKYNYGLGVSFILLVIEAGRNWEWIRNQIISVRAFRVLYRPALYPAYILLFLILLVAVTKGGKFNILGIRLSLTNIYNPIMFLYQYLLIVVLLTLRKNWSRIKAKLMEGQRELILWGILPTSLFLALPEKIKAIIKNIEALRRGEPGPFFENALFYLRSFAEDYSLFWPLGLGVLILCVIAMIKFKQTPSRLRYLFFFFIFGYITLSFSFKLKESRYLANYVPVLWVCSAWALDFISRKIPKNTKAILAVCVLLLAIGFSFFSPIFMDSGKRQLWIPWRHHQMMYLSFIDPVIEMSKDARSILVTGNQDISFGPLLEWKLQIARYKKKNFRVKLVDTSTEKESSRILHESLARAEFDMVALYIVEGGEREADLSKWSQFLKDSEVYRMRWEEFFKEPKPFYIRIYSRGKSE